MVAIAVGSAGCSLMFVNGPHDDYSGRSHVDCTPGRGWPVTDTILGGVFVLDATMAATGGFDDENDETKMSTGQRIGVGATFVGLAALTGYSAYYGFTRSAECRDAQATVARTRPSPPGPGSSPSGFSYVMHTLESVPTDATYQSIEAAARRLGWRATSAPAGDAYRLHFAAGDGARVKVGGAFMDGKPANAVILACAPSSPDRCRKLAEALFAAPGPRAGEAPDDSRGGRLVCRRGAETMEVKVPPGAWAALRDVPTKAGFESDDCSFTPREPPAPTPPTTATSSPSSRATEPLPQLPITLANSTTRVTLLSLTRGREWKGLPTSQKLDVPEGRELVVARYASNPLPGAAKGKASLLLTTRHGNVLQPTSDVVVAVSPEGSTWAERAFVVSPDTRLGVLTIDGVSFDLTRPAPVSSP